MIPVIDFKNVSLFRGENVLLDAISWKVQEGEHWVILGNNGSGKTTLLKVVMGYVWPTVGTVSVAGYTFGSSDLRDLRKKLGWVSNDIHYRMLLLDPSPSAYEVVLSGYYASIGLYEETPTALQERADTLMSTFGCESFKHRSFALLSPGEQKRVLLVRALVNAPDILILDEPCTGLDLVAREFFLLYITQMLTLKTHPTVIYVTHHIEEIVPEISHCLCLKSGKVIASGKKSDVLCSDTLSMVMNIPLTVTARGGRYWVDIKTNVLDVHDPQHVSHSPSLQVISSTCNQDDALESKTPTDIQESSTTPQRLSKKNEPETLIENRHAIIHTDGGSRGNPGPAAIGYVINSPTGILVEEHGEYIGQATNNVAEYKALIAALTSASRRGFLTLDCYLDSELIVQQIKGIYKVKNENLRSFFHKVLKLIKKFTRVSFYHVKREENKRADALVNKALDARRGY